MRTRYWPLGTVAVTLLPPAVLPCVLNVCELVTNCNESIHQPACRLSLVMREPIAPMSSKAVPAVLPKFADRTRTRLQSESHWAPPSHSSPASSTRLPQAGGQSLSSSELAPFGQHASPALGESMVVREQMTPHP